jgi:hypothetical protein
MLPVIHAVTAGALVLILLSASVQVWSWSFSEAASEKVLVLEICGIPHHLQWFISSMIYLHA